MTDSNSERAEAARLAYALLRFASAASHPYLGHTPPGLPKVGAEAFIFSPSWTRILFDDVEQFLTDLSSPALLSPGQIRGTIHLTLVHELSGERRRWAEKTLSNQSDGLDSMMAQLGLDVTARALVEFDEESHTFPLATIRYWAQHFAVEVGWTVSRLEHEPRAAACMMLMRADGNPFAGRSSMLRPGWHRSAR